MILRDILDEDLDILFEQQSNPDAINMAAFTMKDPTNHENFLKFMEKVRKSETVIAKVIEVDFKIVGSLLSYLQEGDTEVSYWLGYEYWGKGYATMALKKFISEINTTRPLYGRFACDNLGSKKVLEKCNFRFLKKERGFANARNQEIDESVYILE
jgi:RimJ/RimL family protein N-acetyltransferase